MSTRKNSIHRLETNMHQEYLMVYFGHHRCASMYIKNVIRTLCNLLGLKIKEEYLSDKLPYDYHLKSYWKEKINTIVVPNLDSSIDFWSHINASKAIVECLKGINYKTFHLIRDTRDILVSGYFSHKYSHPTRKDYNPWLIEHRERLLNVGLEKGLLLELDYCSVFFERLATWDYSDPDIYETRFETLVQKPYDVFYRILNFIGIRFNRFEPVVLVNIAMRKFFKRLFDFSAKQQICSPCILRSVLWEQSFERKARRKRGIEDQKRHYRKGIIGDWKNYFTLKFKTEFKKRYGQLLIDLQYETDDNW